MPDGRSALITIVRGRRQRNRGSPLKGWIPSRSRDPRPWLHLRGAGLAHLPATHDSACHRVRSRQSDRPLTRYPFSRTSVPSRVWHATARLFTFRRAVNPRRGSCGSIAMGCQAIAGERLDYTHLDLAPTTAARLLNLDEGSLDLIDLQAVRGSWWRKDRFPFGLSGGNGDFQRSRRSAISASRQQRSARTSRAKAGFRCADFVERANGRLAYYDHRAFEIWIRSPDGKTRRFLGAPAENVPAASHQTVSGWRS